VAAVIFTFSVACQYSLLVAIAFPSCSCQFDQTEAALAWGSFAPTAKGITCRSHCCPAAFSLTVASAAASLAPAASFSSHYQLRKGRQDHLRESLYWDLMF
jgi:hypothetical protein